MVWIVCVVLALSVAGCSTPAAEFSCSSMPVGETKVLASEAAGLGWEFTLEDDSKVYVSGSGTPFAGKGTVGVSTDGKPCS